MCYVFGYSSFLLLGHLLLPAFRQDVFFIIIDITLFSFYNNFFFS